MSIFFTANPYTFDTHIVMLHNYCAGAIKIDIPQSSVFVRFPFKVVLVNQGLKIMDGKSNTYLWFFEYKI